MAETQSSGFFDRIRAELDRCGIALETLSCGDQNPVGLKVVCMPAGLRESLEDLGKTPRANVVMVRVDDETSRNLDAWVETGVVKTRSQSAALFIREGLKVREHELSDLKTALRGVHDAKEELRRKARKVFGEDNRKE